jgi:hypothetical protein
MAGGDHRREGAVTPAAAYAVDVLGTAVAIRVPPSRREELRSALVDLEPATGADRELTLVEGARGWELRDGGRVVRRGVHPAVAVATVVWRLNAIAAESRSHVLLHAACVTDPDGGGILLVGGSGAGKSTLAAACVRAGYTYLSDELAAIDCRSGTVAPYAKPLVLDGERLVPASTLGRVAAAPAVPTNLVFPRYEPGAPLRETPLEPGWALLALAAHATNLAARGATAFAWLAGVARACPAVQLTHGDARAAAATIRQSAHRPPAPAPAAVLPRLAPDTTTVALANSLAVLHGPTGKVHVLNPAAAAVWRGAASAEVERRDTCHLVDAVLDTFAAGTGECPARSAVAATVDRLVRSGLIAAPARP